MCLGVPMRVYSIDGSSARVELGGLTKEISIMLLPSAKVGDYLIVHAGFAIERIEEEAAQRTIEYLRQIAAEQETKNSKNHDA
jgi:hydrogenase expression/formation protein HypC